ncbi:MAG TPA: hypothetical protein DDZ96_00550 [Porphyromonadaceae bacterium]|nr:hypothetical protein [Porphyromonadaceae bacterium]HBL32293.1 hypothetical protein [Porphyromonadaceae bacterium]HCM22135.1 hypothetical protein [Porphyromonadaceae bacterium]
MWHGNLFYGCFQLPVVHQKTFVSSLSTREKATAFFQLLRQRAKRLQNFCRLFATAQNVYGIFADSPRKNE